MAGAGFGVAYYAHTVYTNPHPEQQVPVKYNPVLYHTSKGIWCAGIGFVVTAFWPISATYG